MFAFKENYGRIEEQSPCGSCWEQSEQERSRQWQEVLYRMSKTENKNVHMIHADAQLGEVQIADEVVAIIAGLAATEVEGVASMAGNVTNELVAKLGMKKLSKGV